MSVCTIPRRVANSVDPDQTPRSAASDLGLHCLLRRSTVNWSNRNPLRNHSGLCRVSTIILHLYLQEPPPIPGKSQMLKQEPPPIPGKSQMLKHEQAQ